MANQPNNSDGNRLPSLGKSKAKWKGELSSYTVTVRTLEGSFPLWWVIKDVWTSLRAVTSLIHTQLQPNLLAITSHEFALKHSCLGFFFNGEHIQLTIYSRCVIIYPSSSICTAIKAQTRPSLLFFEKTFLWSSVKLCLLQLYWVLVILKSDLIKTFCKSR